VEGFFEVSTSDDWHWVFGCFHIGISISVVSSKSSSVFFSRYCVSDGSLCSALAKLGDIGTREVLSQFRHEVEGYVWCNWTLSEYCFENVPSCTFVWQRDVNQLIKTTRSDKSLIQDIWSVGCADKEEILLNTCTVHFSK
jgi:hypothetical protein